MSLVSIITTAFNCEKFIAEAIESVQKQTYTNWELLIADDGSDDATRLLIDKYAARDPRIKPDHNNKNEGIVRTRNKLLKKAQGDYITLLDADDWIKEKKLEYQVSFLQRSSCKAVGVNYYYVFINGDIIANKEGLFQEVISQGHIYQLPFWLPSIMITKDLFQQAGGYARFFEDNACYEDLYWIYELLDITDIGFIPEPLYFYRHNPESVTKTLNLKRLAGKELVKELIQQRFDTGTDWLKKGEYEKANGFMKSLLRDRGWAGSWYQTYAAIKLDEGDMRSARSFLKNAFRLSPFNRNILRTFFYYLRKTVALQDDPIIITEEATLTTKKQQLSKSGKLRPAIQQWQGYQFYANLPQKKFCSFREAGYAAELARTLDKHYPEMYENYDVLWYFQLVHDPETWDIIDGFKKPLILFVVGHEWPVLPEAAIKKAFIVFKQYLGLDQMEQYKNIFRIPVGPSSVFPNVQLVPFQQRKWNVFFVGNLHIGRSKLYEQLTGLRILPFSILHRSRKLMGTDFSNFFPKSILNFSSQFHSGFSTEEYARELASSKLVLCPYGVSEKETMRHFEALKQGCVVVTDKMPETFYFKNAPFIVIDNWKHIRNKLKKILADEDYVEKKGIESYEWWQAVCSIEAITQYIKDRITSCSPPTFNDYALADNA